MCSERISRCGPVGITTHSLEAISGCGPVGVFWRGTVGVVQWVCSIGEQWMWSSGCVL